MSNVLPFPTKPGVKLEEAKSTLETFLSEGKIAQDAAQTTLGSGETLAERTAFRLSLFRHRVAMLYLFEESERMFRLGSGDNGVVPSGLVCSARLGRVEPLL